MLCFWEHVTYGKLCDYETALNHGGGLDPTPVKTLEKIAIISPIEFLPYAEH
jgi:hypothetical protein